jgi:hypothetical protein
VFYFRGRDTSSKTKHNIRKKLYDLSKSKEYSFLDIQLNPTNEQKISDWCQYKYMLDLPGSSPWSIRFKELFLLKSVVVKINVYSKNDENNSYINFYTPLLKKNVDYLNINYNYDEKKDFELLKKELKNIYENIDEKKYKTIMKNGREKIKLLTMANILKYMNYIFQHYESCLLSKNNEDIISLNDNQIIDNNQIIFDKTRPCSSNSRKKNRYTKEELIKLINTYYPNIHLNKKQTINELCSLLSTNTSSPKTKIPSSSSSLKTKIPSSSSSPKTKIIKQLPSSNISSDIIFSDFKKEFESELIGWISKKQQTKFRVMLKGGQNLKLMLTHKYKNTSFIDTKDYDFTVSTNDPLSTYKLWYTKVKSFVDKYPNDLTMKVNNFIKNTEFGKFNKITKITKYYTIFIFYRGNDFIDIAINNDKIMKSNIDVETSLTIGLPIQKLQSTFKELSNLIYRQSTKNDTYTYRSRNAFIGKHRQKGIKDLNRLHLLCSIRKFKPQCNLFKQLEYNLFPITKEYLETKDVNEFEALIEQYFKFKK